MTIERLANLCASNCRGLASDAQRVLSCVRAGKSPAASDIRMLALGLQHVQFLRDSDKQEALALIVADNSPQTHLHLMRVKRHMTLRELAAASGVSYTRISDLEHQRRYIGRVRATTLCALAAALNCSPEELLD